MKTSFGGEDNPFDPTATTWEQYENHFKDMPPLPDVLPPASFRYPCSTCDSQRKPRNGIVFCPFCDRTDHMTCECHHPNLKNSK